MAEVQGVGLALAAVRDLRELRAPASEEEVAGFELEALSGFVLARASAGLTDSTIRNDTNHLEGTSLPDGVARPGSWPPYDPFARPGGGS